MAVVTLLTLPFDGDERFAHPPTRHEITAKARPQKTAKARSKIKLKKGSGRKKTKGKEKERNVKDETAGGAERRVGCVEDGARRALTCALAFPAPSSDSAISKM
jgi:hypothetical protein